MLAMNDHRDLLHHNYREWNTLTHRARETGSYWESHEGRLASLMTFFDGGVDGVGESERTTHFLVELDGL